MTDDILVPAQRPDGENSTSESLALGPRTLRTPRGDVDVVDAPGFSTMLVQSEDPEWSRVGVLVYDPETGKGMIVQFDPASARTTAASLLRLADELEPRTDH